MITIRSSANDSLFVPAVRLSSFYCWTSRLSCRWCMFVERFTFTLPPHRRCWPAHI